MCSGEPSIFVQNIFGFDLFNDKPMASNSKIKGFCCYRENQFCFKICINKEIVSISNAGQHVKSMPSIERRWFHFCIACSKAAMNSAGLIPSPCFTSPCIQNDCERND